MSSPSRVVWCWCGVSGYMAACWRALGGLPEVDLRVIVTPSSRPWDAAMTDDIPDYHLLAAGDDAEAVARLALEHEPDVLVICGWFDRRFTRLATDRRLARVKKIMGMDTPWRGTFRQRATRLLLRGLLGRIDAVVVAGDRAWQYARRLGFPVGRIFRGMYGFDFNTFAEAARRRSQQADWPRRLLFVGRYVPAKGVDVLLEAYARYRVAVADPWPLTCCGEGQLAPLIDRAAGVENLGFVQPRELARVMALHGAYVLPSRFEPWGVALAEALAAGLPVVCSENCGAATDLVRPYYNGLTVPANDAARLAGALCWIHCHIDRLPQMGSRGIHYAQAYSSEAFAEKWLGFLQEVCPSEARSISGARSGAAS